MTASVLGGVRIGGHELRFGINALCEIEAQFDGKTAIEVFGAMQDAPNVTNLRRIFAIGLGMDPEDAGEVIDSAGFGPAMEAFGAAFEAAFPKAEGNSRPRKAARPSTG